MKIPMAKPDIGKEEIDAVRKVIESGWIGQGEITKKFENELENYLNSNAVTVNSGSSAIMCSLLAMGVNSLSTVVVPSFTFLVTASIPKILGAKIIPVDMNRETLNMDLDELEKIVKRQKVDVVIIVDVGGMPNDIDKIKQLSKKYKFTILEDAAEAFGSEYKNKKIGSFQHATIFSFHIAKLITTIEGGCISSKNKTIIKKIKAIKDIGREKPGYVHKYIGSNFRITDLQTAIGRIQLKKVDGYIKKRTSIAEKYRAKINNIGFQSSPSYVTKNGNMLFFGIAKNEKMKKEILNTFWKEKIDSRASWLPVNLQPCNKELYKYKCKNSENNYKKIFTIPIYNTIKNSEVDKIINIINSI
jgi:perosamine synthetase